MVRTWEMPALSPAVKAHDQPLRGRLLLMGNGELPPCPVRVRGVGRVGGSEEHCQNGAAFTEPGGRPSSSCTSVCCTEEARVLRANSRALQHEVHGEFGFPLEKPSAFS